MFVKSLVRFVGEINIVIVSRRAHKTKEWSRSFRGIPYNHMSKKGRYGEIVLNTARIGWYTRSRGKAKRKENWISI